MYPPELVKPMREELTNIGFAQLHTPQDVTDALSKKGTTLVVVNSVCGCAAANARPGARMSLQNDSKPDHLVTVFAGVDREAVETARAQMVPCPPSSPHRRTAGLSRNHERGSSVGRHRSQLDYLGTAGAVPRSADTPLPPRSRRASRSAAPAASSLLVLTSTAFMIW